MRFVTVIRAALIACGMLAGVSAHADGETWERIDGRMTASVSFNGTTRSFPYQSSGFLFNVNQLSAVGRTTDSLYLKMRTRLSDRIAELAATTPQYRGHTVLLNGPTTFEFKGTGGPIIDVSMVGPSASVQLNLTDSKFGITVSCRVNVVSGTTYGTGGKLDLATGKMYGLAISAAAPTHTESCSSSLGWIPVIGSLVDGFITSYASNYLDDMIKAFQNSNPELDPLNFMGLNEAVAGIQWPVGLRPDTAPDFSNLWEALQTTTVSVTINKRPSPGAYVNQDLLRLSYARARSGGGSDTFQLVISEYGSWRIKANPCSPACIPT